ncbi:DUF413 domain-containing protein [Thalassotalea aquiviva]|uniref:DUF413 domain-containing protein n=1 Tax=Thalassotalea aquiviva TaxID=3242415 RepID=UPI00352A387F
MNTSIRKGQYIFYGDPIFTRGLSRSGYFSKRESDELALYGYTLEQLSHGKLLPDNEEEQNFVDAISSEQDSELYAVKLWRKYLGAIAKSRCFHGFAKSNARNQFQPSNDLITEDF